MSQLTQLLAVAAAGAVVFTLATVQPPAPAHVAVPEPVAAPVVSAPPAAVEKKSPRADQRKTVKRDVKPKPKAAPERKTKREKKRDKKKAATSTKPHRRVATNAAPDCARARRERDKIMALPLFERLPAGRKRMAETGTSWAQVHETRRICGI